MKFVELLPTIFVSTLWACSQSAHKVCDDGNTGVGVWHLSGLNPAEFRRHTQTCLSITARRQNSTFVLPYKYLLIFVVLCLFYIETNPLKGNSTHTRQAPFLFSHQDTSDRPIPITNTNHHFRRHQQPPHIMIPQFRHCGRLINCLSHRYCLVVAQSVHCLWYTQALPLTRWAVVYVSIIHLSLFVIRGNT